MTAALSSVSKQASLMSLCPVLTAKRHGYTTLIAVKTGTGRNKQRERDMKMKPRKALQWLCYQAPELLSTSLHFTICYQNSNCHNCKTILDEPRVGQVFGL